MCGIAGWLDGKRDVSQFRHVLEDMTKAMTSQGEEGYWMSQRVGFTHRRLRTIDLEGGSQPLIRRYGDRSCVITFCGELYNKSELRRELSTMGYPFHSFSDTELILAAYDRWGEDCPCHLNGTFAFAIWDEQNQSLFLARDRFGVKPLFYVQRGSTFLFASEIKSLLAHQEVKPVIGEEGLAEVLVMGPSRTPGHGVFKDIRELRPGFTLIATPENTKVSSYWSLVSQSHHDDLETTISQVKDLFQDAVQRQLIADVPVGTMLSGGLDSSAIAACAASCFQKADMGKLSTFSVDYVGNDQYFKSNEFQPNSDATWVRRMTRYLSSHHHNIVVDHDELIDSLGMAVRARDLPGMTDVDASLYLFCKVIKEHVPVVLSGECADEVFGGYPWFHRQELVEADTFPWMRFAKERVSFLAPDIQKWIQPLEYIRNRYEEALAEVPRLSGEEPGDARIREIFYLNVTRWMPTLLERSDRMSMAAGLRVRTPFCDHRLVDYVWNIPWFMKRLKGREKGLLRQAMQGILPEDVRERKKSPFPKTHNPAYLKAVREMALQILDEGTSPVLDVVNVKKWREFAEQDLSQVHFPWFGQLMNVPQLFAYLIQMDIWMREYKVSIQR